MTNNSGNAGVVALGYFTLVVLLIAWIGFFPLAIIWAVNNLGYPLLYTWRVWLSVTILLMAHRGLSKTVQGR